MNKIFNMSYVEASQNPDFECDYLFTSPPDFAELGGNISEESYYEFLGTVVPEKCNLCTFCFTDRKANGKIISKSRLLMAVMENRGWDLCHHKIWAKTLKGNLYRLTYANILAFRKPGFKHANNKVPEFLPDVWLIEHTKYQGYSYGMPVEIPLRCIQHYTSPESLVYDPFMGSGTTAVACVRTNRRYIGFDINREYCDLAEDRLYKETCLFQ